MVGPNTNTFAKTICSICYEDLKPIVEDLQSISICGHVFHELCLQQWFEYCTGSKKQTCPVCKQGCTTKNAGRLYFQSVSDPNDPALSQTQTYNSINNVEDCPEFLLREVKRLEVQVSGFKLALDQHQKEVQHLTDELCICKDQLSKEVKLKNEALKQKECLQAMLQTKSSDLVKSTLECSRLQEKNLALCKELAALKLVSDCNLEEEDIVKLASLGNDAISQHAVDVLKKSLVIRNKSYKELMAKCNSLGRGEARSLRKLEKAKEKMKKLKTRVQELETAIEAKDNEVLRSLKACAKRNCTDVTMPNVNKTVHSSSMLKLSTAEQKDQAPVSVINLDEDEDEDEDEDPYDAKKTDKNDGGIYKFKGDNSKIQHQEVTPCETVIHEEDELEKIETTETSLKALNSMEVPHQKYGSSGPADSDSKEASLNQTGFSGLAGVRNDMVNDCTVVKEDAGLLLQDIRQVRPSSHTRVEASPILLAELGDRCFAGGLLGPDGANMYLGKWCKRVQSKALMGSMHRSNNGSDSLIAVGADGRGGRVKVLRSFNQTTTDAKESVVSAKRFKPAAKSSNLQSQGCLQMEHFFGKVRN